MVFIHSAIHGHVGHFHLLAVVFHAAMNMVCKYLSESLFSILWGVYPEIELLDHLVILLVIF